MSAAHYILRSLLHYRYAYLGVLAGAILGATVLLGALFAGDSVQASLRQIAEKRTGRATHVLTSGDRFFRQALAADLAAAASARTAPLLLTRGTAVHATTQAKANQVQLIGVTADFWQLAPQPADVSLAPADSAVAINDTLARRLNLAVGDTLIVRLQKPGILAGNAPIAGGESTLQSLRCTVVSIVGDSTFGRFSLDATQVPPASVFLPIQRLQESLSQPDRANLVLIGASASSAASTAPAELARHLAATVQLADYGLGLKWIEAARAFEVSSQRIFLDPELSTAVVAAVPAAQPVTSYLVNEFRVRERTTPYSIATATSAAAAPFLPPDLGSREIVLNDWLARDLQAAVGDEVRLTYFQAAAGGALVEQGSSFRVRAITPLQGLAADRSWMPEFPGITNAGSPRQWNPGLPLDLKRIRDQDERYWDAHRGAPKAFLSVAAGRELWSTRWGSHTGLRLAADRSGEAALTATLLHALRPEMNQLLIRNFRAAAADAAAAAVDFGGLFIGMSFFLILAALGLVAMLFQFCLLQRNREEALLGAVGLPARTLQRWRLAEGGVILLVGGAIGLPLATLYTRGILRFLETIWAGGGATFLFAAPPASIAAGGIGFLLISLFALWLAVRRLARRALSIRLAASAEDTTPADKIRRSSWQIMIVALVVAGGALAASGRGLPAQGAFYLAGFALLAAGLALCRAWLARASAPVDDVPLDAAYLGRLNLRARHSRSLTVVGLIATAVFMVLSVASFRKQVGSDWLLPGSGTGGFAFWVETTSPLNPARDRAAGKFEIFESQAAELGTIVSLRAGAGDNVNCFNLNTTAQPQLLAVDPATFAARQAFHLQVPTATGGASGWNALRPVGGTGPIPGFVDETTLMWALKRKVGDVLNYTDENGRSFGVRIAGTLTDSIFQGCVLVDESAFLARFPSHGGYSVFLVDAAAPANLTALQARLTASVGDVGGRVDTTRDVLAAFHQIENTYIAIFNVLGSLGVVLGSLGLAIVVARNLRERRGEFAVMTAVGIPRPVLARMVFTEFGWLVAWGIAVGAVASALAVWPNLSTLPAAPTALLVASLLVGIVALNLLSGWLVFRWSLRDLRPGMVPGAA